MSESLNDFKKDLLERAKTTVQERRQAMLDKIERETKDMTPLEKQNYLKNLPHTSGHVDADVQHVPTPDTTIVCISNDGDTALCDVLHDGEQDMLVIRRDRTIFLQDERIFFKVFQVGVEITSLFVRVGDRFRLRMPEDSL